MQPQLTSCTDILKRLYGKVPHQGWKATGRKDKETKFEEQ